MKMLIINDKTKKFALKQPALAMIMDKTNVCFSCKEIIPHLRRL